MGYDNLLSILEVIALEYNMSANAINVIAARWELRRLTKSMHENETPCQ
jgi:predicted transcriptional regulator